MQPSSSSSSHRLSWVPSWAQQTAYSLVAGVADAFTTGNALLQAKFCLQNDPHAPALSVLKNVAKNPWKGVRTNAGLNAAYMGFITLSNEGAKSALDYAGALTRPEDAHRRVFATSLLAGVATVPYTVVFENILFSIFTGAKKSGMSFVGWQPKGVREVGYVMGLLWGTHTVSQHNPVRPGALHDWSSGFVAGVAAALPTHPFDRAATEMIKIYQQTGEVVTTMAAFGGMLAQPRPMHNIMRGFGIRATLIGCNSAVYMTVLGACRRIWKALDEGE